MEFVFNTPVFSDSSVAKLCNIWIIKFKRAYELSTFRSSLIVILLYIAFSYSIEEGSCRAYKEREAVEVCFKDLKVKMGCDRFDVSSEDSLVGKCFVEFIALSIRMLLLNIILKCKRKGYKYPTDSLEKIIHELDGISQVEYTNGFVSLMDVSKTQHQILRMFHCTIPDDYYSNNLAYANRLDKAKKPHGDN
ncbi:MAG: hypothetical protein U0M61_04130 [Succinivibrio sp.]|nr:hypothetical protein [Succinivibrio sp.]